MIATQAHTIERPAHFTVRAPRTMTTLLVARLLRPGHPDTLCRIRNVSATGLLTETPIALAPGMPVSIKFRGGTLVEGCVAWCEGGRAGIAVSTKIDLDRFLSEMPDGVGLPRAPRFDAGCPVRLDNHGQIRTGTLQNLSQTGARLSLAEPIARGSAHSIAIPGLAPRYCVIRWSDGEEAGARFVEPLAFDELATWLHAG